MKFDELYAGIYKNRCNRVVENASRTLHHQLSSVGYKVEAKEQAKILDALKKSCREEIAKAMTTIVQHDQTLGKVYSKVYIKYSEKQNKFNYLGPISYSEEIIAELNKTKPHINFSSLEYDYKIKRLRGNVEPELITNMMLALNTSLGDPIKKLEDAMTQLNEGIDKDLEEAMTNILAQQDGYREKVKIWRTGGAVLTVLSYLAGIGSMGGAVALFIDHKASRKLAMNTAFSPSIDWNGLTLEQANLQYAVEWAQHQAFKTALKDQAGLQFMGATALGVIAILIMTTAYLIVWQSEHLASEHTNGDIRHELGGEEQKKPRERNLMEIIVERVLEAISTVKQQKTIEPSNPSIKDETTTLLSNLCNRLSSFSKTLAEVAQEKPANKMGVIKN
ncbi:MAG: hypothetical protein JSS50_02040 [Proteobacteria bacterium]|nr:hypothetical protein [Pseudomonadota bacterium]